MARLKDVYSNPEMFIYKLRNGSVYIPLYNNYWKQYQLCSLEEMLNPKSKRYNMLGILFNDYEWYERDENYSIKLKLEYAKDYVDNGIEYDIIAYKYCNNIQKAISNIIQPDNIMWTWIADDCED